MAKSAKQIEAEVLAFLDTIGQDKAAFQEVTKLEGVEKYIILAAANFILKVQENLDTAGKVDTGTLSSQITQGDLIETGSGCELEIGYPAGSKAAKYYDFVNKGVKGTRGGPDSIYSFKNDKPGYAMTSALEGWYKRQGKAGLRETQKKNLSAVQRKRNIVFGLGFVKPWKTAGYVLIAPCGYIVIFNISKHCTLAAGGIGHKQKSGLPGRHFYTN